MLKTKFDELSVQDPSPFRDQEELPPPAMPQPQPPQSLADGLLPRATIDSDPLPVSAPLGSPSLTPPPLTPPPFEVTPFTPPPAPVAQAVASPDPDTQLAGTPAPVAQAEASPDPGTQLADTPAPTPVAQAVASPDPGTQLSGTPAPVEANAPDSTRTSFFIKIFLVIFFGGAFLATGSGIYLYLNWEKHFPPSAELQEKVLPTPSAEPAEAEVEVAAVERNERIGYGEWLAPLSTRMEERADAASQPLEVDHAKATESAENADDPDLPAQQPLYEFLPEDLQPPAQPDPKAKPPNSGTIEKMEDDWLPPGVTRTK